MFLIQNSHVLKTLKIYITCLSCNISIALFPIICVLMQTIGLLVDLYLHVDSRPSFDHFYNLCANKKKYSPMFQIDTAFFRSK